MDSTTYNSWSKLYNITNKTFLKIFVDKVSINNYKQKYEELNREIVLMKEQSERYTKANEALEKHVLYMKTTYESKIKDLPLYSNICKCLKQCLADAQIRYKDREVYLEKNEREMKQNYDNLVKESDAVWPECQQLKQEKANLDNLELNLKILLKDIEEEREKIKLKKFIDKQLFNEVIVKFVRKVKKQKENIKVIAEIERYTRNGNLLLKEYEKAMLNAEKRRSEEFLHCDTMIKSKKDDLPQIESTVRASPTPSTSSLLNASYSSETIYDTTAFEKYKQRELERRRRLHKLAKHNLLNSSMSINKPRVEQESKPQPPPPTPKKPSTTKVEIINQVFMTPKRKAESNVEVLEQKMPRVNSGSQFGKSKDINRGFGKLLEIEPKFPADNENSMPEASEKVDELVRPNQFTPFCEFRQIKEVPKPQKENKTQEQQKHEMQKTGNIRPKISFEKDESNFFATSKPEQKKPASPPKPAEDDVFKMPRPYDASFDFMNSSYNQGVPDNNSQNLLERSFGDLPTCFSPPPSYQSNNDAQLMFTETSESPLGSFFMFK